MKKYVIVDIDGTIANGKHREHFLHQEEKDWDSYFSNCDKDTPIQEIVDLVETLGKNGYEIIFCTGRRDTEREKTVKWLWELFIKDEPYNMDDIDHDTILMRKEGDFRHDTIVKPELLEEARIPKDQIAFILEDRNSMVKKWRELGIKCLQVAEGDF
jgi:hypothetical protein